MQYRIPPHPVYGPTVHITPFMFLTNVFLPPDDLIFMIDKWNPILQKWHSRHHRMGSIMKDGQSSTQTITQQRPPIMTTQVTTKVRQWGLPTTNQATNQPTIQMTSKETRQMTTNQVHLTPRPLYTQPDQVHPTTMITRKRTLEEALLLPQDPTLAILQTPQ